MKTYVINSNVKCSKYNKWIYKKLTFKFGQSHFLLSIDLYTRVWDVADYVIPPAENGAFFVATNVIITANQTRGNNTIYRYTYV